MGNLPSISQSAPEHARCEGVRAHAQRAQRAGARAPTGTHRCRRACAAAELLLSDHACAGRSQRRIGALLSDHWCRSAGSRLDPCAPEPGLQGVARRALLRVASAARGGSRVLRRGRSAADRGLRARIFRQVVGSAGRQLRTLRHREPAEVFSGDRRRRAHGSGRHVERAAIARTRRSC